MFAVEVIHREVDALQPAALDRQVAGLRWRRCRGRWRENSLRKICGSTLSPTLALQMNLMPSCSMSADAAQDDLPLVELHVRDAVHEQSARAVGALEDRDRVAGAVELGGGGQAGGAGADDGDLLAGAHGRGLRR